MTAFAQFTLSLSGTLQAQAAREFTAAIQKRKASEVSLADVEDTLAHYVDERDRIVVEWFTVDVLKAPDGSLSFPDLEKALLRFQSIGLASVAQMTPITPHSDKNTTYVVLAPNMSAPRQIIRAPSHAKLIPAHLAQDESYMAEFPAAATYLDTHRSKKFIYNPTAHDLMAAQSMY